MLKVFRYLEIMLILPVWAPWVVRITGADSVFLAVWFKILNIVSGRVGIVESVVIEAHAEIKAFGGNYFHGVADQDVQVPAYFDVGFRGLRKRLVVQNSIIIKPERSGVIQRNIRSSVDW